MKKIILNISLAITLTGCAGVQKFSTTITDPIESVCIVENDALFGMKVEPLLVEAFNKHSKAWLSPSIYDAKNDKCSHYALVRVTKGVDMFEFIAGMQVTVYTNDGFQIGMSSFTVPNNANMGKFSSGMNSIEPMIDDLFRG